MSDGTDRCAFCGHRRSNHQGTDTSRRLGQVALCVGDDGLGCRPARCPEFQESAQLPPTPAAKDCRDGKFPATDEAVTTKDKLTGAAVVLVVGASILGLVGAAVWLAAGLRFLWRGCS